MVKNGDLIDVEPDGTITVAGKPIGGDNDRVLTLIAPFKKGNLDNNKKIYIDDDTYLKIAECYYESIKIYFNDENPLGIFNVLNVFDFDNNVITSKYLSPSDYDSSSKLNAWYGKNVTRPWTAMIYLGGVDGSRYIQIRGYQPLTIPELDKSNFDALYKLADKPTQDGTYILKATVSGGAVTYTWVKEA